MLKPDVVPWLKKLCNRFTNGYCGSLWCLQRGGYQRGYKYGPEGYEMSTCEPHEVVQEFERLNTELEPKPKHSPGCCCGRC